MSAAPADAVERARLRHELGETVFVEASAGTGKTRALVDRVVALVAAGTPVTSLAAITFTDAAAAELRDRVRAELSATAHGLRPELADPAARERCRVALDAVDDAVITTLHGFAGRILGAHPLEAGLPPRFEVLDTAVADAEADRSWTAFVEDLFADDALAPTLELAIELGLTPARLRPVVDVLRTRPDRLDEHLEGVLRATFPRPTDAAALLDGLRAAVALAPACTDPDDRLHTHLLALDRLLPSLERAAGDGIGPLAVSLDRAGRLSRGNAGRKASWHGVDPADLRDRLGALEERRTALVRGVAAGALAELVARAVHFLRLESEARRRTGRLEYDDLLTAARDLLRDSAPARVALSEQYRVLLVDELQDTDPLQIELAVRLAAADPRAASGAWEEIDVAAGRLFVVGDPKQSIYRFRRADLELFERVRASFDEEVSLRTCFRSVPAVVAWVDAAFGHLFGAGEPGVQARHVPQVPHRDALAGPGPAVAVLGGPHEGSPDGARATAGELRAAEARDVALAVGRVLQEGWRVLDPATGRVRAAEPSDVAILLPTRAALPFLEDALGAARIPYSVESESLVYATDEVRELTAALGAIDDPADSIALVATLRRAGFGCSDAELAAFVEAGGRWDLREPGSSLEPTHPVLESIARLRHLHELRWSLPLDRLVRATVAEARPFELATARPRPRESWRRVQLVLDAARTFTASGATLREFVEWLRARYVERTRAVDLIAAEPDDDAVHVRTIHSAKGLEYPVVVLADLGGARRDTKPAVCWIDGRPEARINLGEHREVATSGYDLAWTLERARLDAEQLRLLYVAATRARDHLLVGLHHVPAAEDGRPTLAEGLHRIAPDLPHRPLDLGTATGGPARPETVEPGPAARTPGAAPLTAAEAARRRAERAARMARAAEGIATSPTAIAAALAGAGRRPGATTPPAAPEPAGGDDLEPGDAPADEDPAGVAPPQRRGRAGTAIGRAAHAVLERVELAPAGGLDQRGDPVTPAGLAALARAEAGAEGIPERAEEVGALVASALAAPSVRRAAAARHWRELPLAVRIEGEVVEGYVDLLVETDEGLAVVDYKTDHLRDGVALEDAVTRYAPQLATYALALEEGLHRPVARATLVFARAGAAAIERDVPDLPGETARVRTLLAGRARARPPVWNTRHP